MKRQIKIKVKLYERIELGEDKDKVHVFMEEKVLWKGVTGYLCNMSL